MGEYFLRMYGLAGGLYPVEPVVVACFSVLQEPNVGVPGLGLVGAPSSTADTETNHYQPSLFGGVMLVHPSTIMTGNWTITGAQMKESLENMMVFPFNLLSSMKYPLYG
jgi:hypothetical protein